MGLSRKMSTENFKKANPTVTGGRQSFQPRQIAWGDRLRQSTQAEACGYLKQHCPEGVISNELYYSGLIHSNF
jgi:hypothetical protein